MNVIMVMIGSRYIGGIDSSFMKKFISGMLSNSSIMLLISSVVIMF